jgi:uncharacterized protein YfdQ (DUF2303 family)
VSDVTNDAQAIIDTATAATEPKVLDVEQVVSVIVPPGARHEVVDLEKFQDRPRRTKGSVTTQTVDDFCKYVARHDDAATTTVWVDLNTHRVVAVLNDHGADGAEFGDHRALLQLQQTEEWQHWTANDGRWLTQEAFAEHIEDGLQEIVTPEGAVMLELAQSIEGTKTAEFKQGHRLANGQVAVQYVEEVTASAGARGEIEIPERFELAVAPFLGEETYKVGARLRYRVRDGHLGLKYDLDRPHDVVRDAIDQIADRLDKRFAGERVFIGTPRGS